MSSSAGTLEAPEPNVPAPPRPAYRGGEPAAGRPALESVPASCFVKLSLPLLPCVFPARRHQFPSPLHRAVPPAAPASYPPASERYGGGGGGGVLPPHPESEEAYEGRTLVGGLHIPGQPPGPRPTSRRCFTCVVGSVATCNSCPHHTRANLI